MCPLFSKASLTEWSHIHRKTAVGASSNYRVNTNVSVCVEPVSVPAPWTRAKATTRQPQLSPLSLLPRLTCLLFSNWKWIIQVTLAMVPLDCGLPQLTQRPGREKVFPLDILVRPG